VYTPIPKNLLTIYGRNPVLEALQDHSIDFFRVHLADSNKPNASIKSVEALCEKRGIEIVYHDRLALSRISKNRKQDQGIAADIIGKHFEEFDEFIDRHKDTPFRLIGLENITNPQNLGMIIRSVCAGTVDGLLLPRKGCAKLDGLVIKASAGTLFKTRVIFCDDLYQALARSRQQGVEIAGLSLKNSESLAKTKIADKSIMLLGNETEGLSPQASSLCDKLLYIPMQNHVESLNVAITAGILSFYSLFTE